MTCSRPGASVNDERMQTSIKSRGPSGETEDVRVVMTVVERWRRVTDSPVCLFPTNAFEAGTKRSCRRPDAPTPVTSTITTTANPHESRHGCYSRREIELGSALGDRRPSNCLPNRPVLADFTCESAEKSSHGMPTAHPSRYRAFLIARAISLSPKKRPL